jgi:hypothetical protein
MTSHWHCWSTFSFPTYTTFLNTVKIWTKNYLKRRKILPEGRRKFIRLGVVSTRMTKFLRECKVHITSSYDHEGCFLTWWHSQAAHMTQHLATTHQPWRLGGCPESRIKNAAVNGLGYFNLGSSTSIYRTWAPKKDNCGTWSVESDNSSHDQEMKPRNKFPFTLRECCWVVNEYRKYRRKTTGEEVLYQYLNGDYQRRLAILPRVEVLGSERWLDLESWLYHGPCINEWVKWVLTTWCTSSRLNCSTN